MPADRARGGRRSCVDSAPGGERAPERGRGVSVPGPHSGRHPDPIGAPPTAPDPLATEQHLFGDLHSRPTGLSDREAERRLTEYGANTIHRRGRRRWWDGIVAPAHPSAGASALGRVGPRVACRHTGPRGGDRGRDPDQRDLRAVPGASGRAGRRGARRVPTRAGHGAERWSSSSSSRRGSWSLET